MALNDLLETTSKRSDKLNYLIGSESTVVKDEISEERLMEHIDEVRELIAFYREYPDLFIDDIKGPDSVFNFRFSQRIFLRAVMRHRYVYATFTRGKQRLLKPVFLLIAGKPIKL